MSFTSIAFLVFLPVVWAAYWGLRRREWQNLLLVCASYVFYGWWDERFCILMLTSSLVDYWLGLALGPVSPDSDRQETGSVVSGRRRLLLGMSLACNLGLLGVFKYFGFFVDSFQASAAFLGWSPGGVTLEIILPVGISVWGNIHDRFTPSAFYPTATNIHIEGNELEVLPKTIGVVYSRQLAPIVAPPIHMLVGVFKPLIALTQVVTSLVRKGHQEHRVSDEDLLMLVGSGLRAGTLKQHEARVIENVLSMETRTAKQIMTPRPVVFTLGARVSAREATSDEALSKHSRIPIFDANAEERLTLGFISMTRILPFSGFKAN